MRAALDDAATLKHHDTVRIPYRGETVGDDEGRAALHEPIHAVLYDALGSGIDGAGRLIENEHRRICDGRPGNREELTLSLAQVCTVAGEHRVIPVRKTADEAVRICKPCSCDDLFFCGIEFSETDVFSYRSGKEMCILQNDAEGPTQVGFFDFIDIDAIIADLAVLDVVKAVDQVCDCRLTGPGGADKCDFLSRLRVQLYVVEYDLVIRVAEVHAVEYDVAAQLFVVDGAVRLVCVLPCPLSGAGSTFGELSVFFLCINEQYIAVVLLDRFIHQPEDTVRSGHRHDDRIELLADLIDWHVETLVKCQKAGKAAKGKSSEPI